MAGDETGGRPGDLLHHPPVLLPPGRGPGTQAPGGEAGEFLSDLQPPEAVTASHPEPPPADERRAGDVAGGEVGEDPQQDIFCDVCPVRHH